MTPRVVNSILFFLLTSVNLQAQNEFDKRTFTEGLSYLQLNPHELNSERARIYLRNSQQYHQEINKACGLSKTFALTGRLFFNLGKVDSAGFYFLQASRDIV